LKKYYFQIIIKWELSLLNGKIGQRRETKRIGGWSFEMGMGSGKNEGDQKKN